MATVVDLRESLLAVNMAVECHAAIDKTAGMIVEFNKQQLKRGLSAGPARISPKYKKKDYAVEKNAMNPLPGYGIPDLLYTGDFYAGFGIEVKADEYEVFSTDPKAYELEAKYKQIFGMNQESKRTYSQEHVLPELQRTITEKTGLSFS